MCEESVAPAMHIQSEQNGCDANDGQKSKSHREDEASQSSGGRQFHDTRRLPAIHLRDKTIAASGQRFDETGIFRRVSQHLANLVDRGIQVVFYIDKGVGPKPFL